MQNLTQFITNVVQFIINPLIWLLFALALYYFVIGIIPFMMKSDDPKERAKGRQHLLWSIVGFFIMVSVVAILATITATFCDGIAFCGNPNLPANPTF